MDGSARLLMGLVDAMPLEQLAAVQGFRLKAERPDRRERVAAANASAPQCGSAQRIRGRAAVSSAHAWGRYVRMGDLLLLHYQVAIYNMHD
jgi:hypothetical protein